MLHLIQIQRLGSKMTFLDDFGADCEKNARVETIRLSLAEKIHIWETAQHSEVKAVIWSQILDICLAGRAVWI